MHAMEMGVVWWVVTRHIAQVSLQCDEVCCWMVMPTCGLAAELASGLCASPAVEFTFGAFCLPDMRGAAAWLAVHSTCRCSHCVALICCASVHAGAQCVAGCLCVASV